MNKKRNNPINWDASTYFKSLTARNKLAKLHGFCFCEVSGLEGFEEALHLLQNNTAFVCVSDISDGNITLAGSPTTTRTKCVFFAMRHAIDDMTERKRCFAIMQELFRQFMSHFVREKTRLANSYIFPKSSVNFNEIDSYFFSGCACAFCNITVSNYTNLVYDESEWE